MKKIRTDAFAVVLCVATSVPNIPFVLTSSTPAMGQTQASQQRGSGEPEGSASVTPRIGSIKAIDGNRVTMTMDSGSETNVAVDSTTKILRIAPGEKDLKNATRLQLQDLQVGDRILVGGKPGNSADSIMATSVVVMKRSDVEARQQHDREDWQKRGVGGLVKALDPARGTVTIEISDFTGTKAVIVHTSKETVFRRYASDSVKFDDAKLSTLHEIKLGDQLRARGNRSGDGSELSADEIVSGTFRNVVGTINSLDAGTGTLGVQDLLTKKPLKLKITAESQLRKLPATVAQRVAMRLKGSPTTQGDARPGRSAPSTAGGEGGGMGGPPQLGGAPDFQNMLGRMPAASISDLQKGDAVMIVSTEEVASSAATVITLLSGVEPILQAAPSASQAALLTPWTLSAPAGDAANQ